MKSRVIRRDPLAKLHRMALIVLGPLSLALAIGCRIPAGDPTSLDRELDGEQRGEVEASDLRNYPETESAPLDVTYPGLSTDGRVAKIRGRIINPYAEAVHGVRCAAFIVSAGGSGERRVLDVYRRDTDVTIQPGGSTILRLDMESMYFGSNGGEFFVVAFPKKVGDREIPPPPDW